MPFNGSGTFSLQTPPSPFVTGTTISAPDVNTVLSDIATNGLTNAVTRDGQSPLTGNWPVGGYNITGIATLSATTLNVSGTATIGTLSVTTVSPTTLTVSGNGTIGGTLGVTGAITGSSTITATAAIVTGSTAPANGMYLPATNTVALATNSTRRLSVNASGAIGIGSSPDYGTAGQVLTSAGSSAAPTWAAASSYTPTGTLGSPFNASFPIGSGTAVFKAGTGTTNGSGDLTVTYATAFPNASVAVVACLNGSPSNANTYVFVSTSSASGFTISAQSDSGNPRASVGVSWHAIGY